MEKDNLDLKAKVKGDPEPTVTWYRDDKQLAATLKVAISKTKDEHTVKIQQVTSAAAGTYKCVATNTLGSDEHTAVVTITGLYSLLSPSYSLAIKPFSHDRFSCDNG